MKRIALVLILCILLCSCAAPVATTPPTRILYLGGASILNEFQIMGGPGPNRPENTSPFHSNEKDIVISVPGTLERQGFHFCVFGYLSDGTKQIIHTEADIAPGSYLVISKDVYSKYVELYLKLDYTWNGTLMSMRTVNLFTLEEQSSVSQEFD